MRTRARGAAAVLLAWLLLAAATVAPPPAAAIVTPASDEITLRCGLFRTVDVSVDWYVPVEAEPHALVYVQHGFLGTKRQMRDLALAFAREGYLVMVPTLSSFLPTCGVRSAGLLHDLATSGTDGRLRESLERATGHNSLPRDVIVVGHSIGAAAVTFVAGQHPVNSVVRLIIHMDAVETTNGLLATALQQGAGDENHVDAPILQLTAPASPLNADNSGPRVVGTFRAGGSYADGIDGAVVVTGTHCDPLGNYPFNICGSTPRNQRAFFDLAVAGANDILDRTDAETFDAAVERLNGLVARTPRLMSA